MKRMFACALVGLSLALPNVSAAHGPDGGYGYRHGGPGEFIGDVVALPFVIAGTILGVAATVATAPFYADGYYDERPGPVYYGPPAQSYYAPPAPSYYVRPAPSYYAPPRVYYRQSYAPAYYAPPRVYYAQPAYRPVYAPRPVYQGYYPPPAVYGR